VITARRRQSFLGRARKSLDFGRCYFFAISPATRYLIKEAISFAAGEPTGHQAVEKRFFSVLPVYRGGDLADIDLILCNAACARKNRRRCI
jgi:hypothetical protein